MDGFDAGQPLESSTDVDPVEAQLPATPVKAPESGLAELAGLDFQPAPISDVFSAGIFQPSQPNNFGSQFGASNPFQGESIVNNSNEAPPSVIDGATYPG